MAAKNNCLANNNNSRSGAYANKVAVKPKSGLTNTHWNNAWRHRVAAAAYTEAMMTLADLYDQHANECLGSAEFGTLLGSGLEGPLAAPLALEAWPNTSDSAAAGAAAVNGGCDPFEMPGFLDAKNRVPLTPEQEKRLAEVTAQSAEAKRTNPDADRVRAELAARPSARCAHGRPGSASASQRDAAALRAAPRSRR
jgi:hypothetical protein